MIRFESDYLEGAHPNILEKLVETNYDQTGGYGNDKYCDDAKNKLKKMCKNDDVNIHFVAGGTMANKIVITTILKPYQGVLCANTGHINIHETGAIEARGHKVLTCESPDGKIKASQIKETMDTYLDDETKIHIVQPGMVYISQPTEVGTMYSKKELEEISKICKLYKLPLYVDGARLGYVLASKYNDISLEDLTKLTDVYYIGGTKVGAFFGEAIVFTNKELEKDYIYICKQSGGLLAKGRLLGIQFGELFKDDLYINMCKEPVQRAIDIRHAFENKGFKMMFDSWTNQQFPILSNEAIDKLKENYTFSIMEKIDSNHRLVRFCTSWATKNKDVEKLISDIEKL